MKPNKWLVLPVSLLTGSVLMSAQSYMDEPGIPVFTTSFPVEHGFINLANGVLHIEIPVESYPQRDKSKVLHARLVYDSRFWLVVTDPVSQIATWQTNGGPALPQHALALGWNLVTDGEPANVNSTFTSKICRCLKSNSDGTCVQPVFINTFPIISTRNPTEPCTGLRSSSNSRLRAAETL